MHMADALVSPVVGLTMLAVSASIVAYSIKKSKIDINEKKIPLMGVAGALIFASQMINFTIPATGSSGHIGGALLLAILLGPYAGFLTIAAVLIIQALFFADGGLLALGCNIFNMGFFSCFIAYPLIFKPIFKRYHSTKGIFIGTILAAILSLQLGAFSVVLQTLFSGITDLPFSSFLILMQPIHLAIGIIEGIVTAAVAVYVLKIRPEIIDNAIERREIKDLSIKKVITTIAIITVITGGLISWYASTHPDGLEWSMQRVLGSKEIISNNVFHNFFANIQERIAILPDYGFKTIDMSKSTQDAGKSVSGIVGGIITLSIVCVTGSILFLFKKKRKNAE